MIENADFGVRVRMLQGAIGESILVTIAAGGASTRPFHMMIDCGLVPRAGACAEQELGRAIEEVARLTGGKVDVLVVSRVHWDHLSGFLQHRDWFDVLEFDQVWLPWTEDPGDPFARQLAGARRDSLRCLETGLAKLRASGSTEAAALALGIEKLLAPFEGGAAERALEVARKLGAQRPRYCRPHDAPWTSDRVPGVRFYVLGPPETMAAPSNPSNGFRAALGTLRGDAENHYPFDASARIDLASLQALAADRTAEGADGVLVEFFREHYFGHARTTGGLDQKWRTVEEDWLATSRNVALELDRTTHESSLTLAIELGESGQVLVFAAGAGTPTWQSARELTWTVPSGHEPAAANPTVGEHKVSAVDLLRRAVFYKVGRRAGYGVSASEVGIDLMPGEGLVAVVATSMSMAPALAPAFDALVREKKQFAHPYAVAPALAHTDHFLEYQLGAPLDSPTARPVARPVPRSFRKVLTEWVGSAGSTGSGPALAGLLLMPDASVAAPASGVAAHLELDRLRSRELLGKTPAAECEKWFSQHAASPISAEWTPDRVADFSGALELSNELASAGVAVIWPVQGSDYPVGFRWPLTLSGDPRLLDALQDPELQMVQRFTRRAAPDSPPDLLIARGLPRQANADLVIAFCSGATLPSLVEIDQLTATGRVGAVLVVESSPRDAKWIDDLIYEMTHDLRFDEAVRRVAVDHQHPGRFLLVAPPSFAEAMRVQERARRLRKSVASPELRGQIDFLLNNGDFRGETHNATRFLEIAATARDKIDRAERGVSARWLHAGMIPAGAKAPSPTVHAGNNYALRVLISPGQPGYAKAERRFPDWKLPPAEAHTLDVIVSCPDLLAEPFTGKIRLPRAGPSDILEVPITVPAGKSGERFWARISVVHRNRELHSALLSAPILAPDSRGLEADHLVLRVEGSCRALDDLDSMSEFQATMVVNHNDHGPALTAIKDGRAYQLPLADVEKLLDGIYAALTTLAAQPDLEDAEAVEALRKIASLGSRLRKAVQTDGGGTRLDALENPGPIQLVTKTRNARFPIELLYDGPAPEKARLCSHAQKLGENPAICAQGRKGTAICPAGFWGLNRVIERFAHDGNAALALAADFALLAIPPERLTERSPPSTFLFGASKLFETALGAGKLVTKFERGARKIFEALSWEDLPGMVKNNPPDLVLLLAHCEPYEKDIERSTLEIGGAFAPPIEVESKHIRASETGPGPIVLLLACEAEKAAVVPFLGPVADLQRTGASIVVATSVSIYTNLTADVAAEFLDQVDELSKQKSWTFGELMRAVRSEMFTKRPMVLSLTAFGDADWRFQKV